ncbi:MAG: sulfatase [Phycisphaeraceae bacterium]
MRAISRRDFIQETGAAALTALATPALLHAAEAEAKRLPNILLVTAAGRGRADLGHFATQRPHTPTIDRLAAQGAVLNALYRPAPTHEAALGSLLTGQYPGRADRATALPALLRSRGYAAALVGSWPLADRPERFGFEQALAPNPASDPAGAERRTAAAEAFLASRRRRPMLLHLAHELVRRPGYVPAPAEAEPVRESYAVSIEDVDASLARLLARLEQLGLGRNTILLFVSDPGPWLPHARQAGEPMPLRGGPGTTWEGGQRVAAFAWAPGRIRAGSTIAQPASTLDLPATLARLARVETHLAGRDLAPALLGQTVARADVALIYHHPAGPREAVRVGDWKYRAAPGEPPQLFHLADDPGETTNLLERHPNRAAALRGLLERAPRSTGRSDTRTRPRPRTSADLSRSSRSTASSDPTSPARTANPPT